MFSHRHRLIWMFSNQPWCSLVGVWKRSNLVQTSLHTFYTRDTLWLQQHSGKYLVFVGKPQGAVVPFGARRRQIVSTLFNSKVSVVKILPVKRLPGLRKSRPQIKMNDVKINTTGKPATEWKAPVVEHVRNHLVKE